MSYWKSRHGIIGDSAADEFGDAIDAIREQYRIAVGREPSKGELRDALEFVIAPLDELPERGRVPERPRNAARVTQTEIIPFAAVGEASGEPYPAWIRELGRRDGVYFIRERISGEIVYIGESHSQRLYATLTRHFQLWSNDHNTAGATYERSDVLVAVVLVPEAHAMYLQNELICIFDPRDNRLLCDQLFAESEDEREPPPGYDYDVSMLIDSIFHEFDHSGAAVPF